MNEMRCVNMHSPVLLFIPRSSQPAEPQIPTEEKTFWMRTHCGFPCQNSAGHEGCVSAYSLASFRSRERWGFLGSTTEQPVLSGISSEITGTFTVHLYLWNTFGSLSPLDVCLPFSALLRELWKAGAGTLQAFPVGVSFRLNFPLEFHFPGDPNRKPNR